MANQEHLDILKQGVDVWNQWREEHPAIRPDLCLANFQGASLTRTNLSFVDLSGANLTEADLSPANLSGADLRGAKLIEAHLGMADLSFANLSGANLWGASLRGTDVYKADLSMANLSEAHLEGAKFVKANLSRARLMRAHLSVADLSDAILQRTDLSGADLSEAILRGADFGSANLSNANLSQTMLVRANLSETILTGCRIYGVAVWDVQIENAIQTNLVITLPGQPTITVDNLEVAQFIYLLLNNERISRVIDTITSKVILILGHFTPERKTVLDALRDELRKKDYLPIVFDFDEPAKRDVTETVTTLARLSRFIIADITDSRSIPQKLSLIVPTLPSVPVQPLLHSSQREDGMFSFFTRYPWVLPLHHYTDQASLLQSLKEKVIDPAESKAQELREERKRNQLSSE